jgi:hypothetical protein
MAKCKLLAFLLCESASISPGLDRKVTLHHLFDRMILPPNPKKTDLIFAYYKIVAGGPCTVALRVTDPQQKEVRGNWRHSIGQPGPIQGVWALDTGFFKEAGHYVVELKEENDGSQSDSLASMRLVVEQEGE